MKNRQTYLKKLIDFKDHEQIKVITGIRRCGKSSLLVLFEQYLKSIGVLESNIIKINFEDLQYGEMSYKDLNNFVIEKLKNTRGKVYLLFDEIQKIEKWELTINSLRLDKRTDIYITGSNAYLLSSQLATYLAGRYVEIKMRVLSFKEFVGFYDFNKISVREKFNLFLKFGAMPGLKALNFNEEMVYQTLEGIFSTVLIKDVIEKADVKDSVLLKKIIKFLADNVGNNVSVNKIKNTLVSQNGISNGVKAGTIEQYIELLQNAFIFYHVQRYDIKGKEYLKTLGKYYIADLGLRNYLLGFRDMDRGHVLENIVYLELLNRGFQVSVGKVNDVEIDFIATKLNEKKYFQVCETISSEKTRVRELLPLKSLRDNHEKTILTLDEVFSGMDEDGIKIVNLIEWLLM